MRRIGLVGAALVVTIVTAGALRWRAQAPRQEAPGRTPIAAAQTEVATLNLPQMDCAGCAMGVKVAAGRIDGVHDVTIDLEARRADVAFDPSKTTAEAIAAAITQGTGFKAEVLKSTKKS